MEVPADQEFGSVRKMICWFMFELAQGDYLHTEL